MLQTFIDTSYQDMNMMYILYVIQTSHIALSTISVRHPTCWYIHIDGGYFYA